MAQAGSITAVGALGRLAKYPDMAIALALVGLIVVMVIPVPAFVLDLLLTLSIALSVMILLVALYLSHPLEFSSFPTMLLFATLFRLSLNVATTRIILLHGSEGPQAAGHVIQAFGNFVVGGNYVVGMIVFVVLVLINFVVITKGAGRIAEVAARFTLDAMPGKQMAIDADLNSGLVDEAGARARRRSIEREADFYGAMDGASKFVRGDAVAGIVIAIVNIIGGFIIGVLQQKMSIGDAAQNYTLLTVGDGLVSQIPALVVSTSAGIVVSRASSEADLSHAITEQIFGKSRAMLMAAGILAFFGLMPGLPAPPFLVLAGVLAFGGMQVAKAKKRADAAAMAEQKKPAPPEAVENLLELAMVRLEVGYGLINLVDIEQGGELLDKVRALRRQFVQRMGIVIPPIHIQDNLQLSPGEYRIHIKSAEVGRGELMIDRLLAMDPGGVTQRIDGIETKEPAFGLPAVWIRKADRDRAQFAGYTVVDPATIITTHLSELFRRHSHELLGRQEVQALLDNVKQRTPKVVSELVPDLLSIGQVQKVLQNLLREEISIRDLVTVLEALADWAPMTKDADVLTEYARQALSRQITQGLCQSGSTLHVVTLEQTLEKLISDSVRQTPQGSYLALEPATAQVLLSRIEEAIKEFDVKGMRPILLMSPLLRGHLRRFIERFVPQLAVISHNEVDPGAKVMSLRSLRL